MVSQPSYVVELQHMEADFGGKIRDKIGLRHSSGSGLPDSILRCSW